MKFIIFILIGLLVLGVIFIPFLRGILLHPFLTLYYGIKDLFFYFKHKKYNIPDSGFIRVYAGLFGSGKTLSATSYVYRQYKRYNNRFVWVRDGEPKGKHFRSWRIPGHFERCKVNILSNVDLIGIPYERLVSLQQVVDWTAYAPAHPNEWMIVLIDEASAILNSREFKNNFDFFSLNALVTCRHFNMGLLLTSQRFLLIDKLAREVCQDVIQCQKIWRVLLHFKYDAYELENCSNPLQIKPKAIRVQFVRDRAFNTYDTLATVSAIEKACKEGKMRSEKEILEATALDAPAPVQRNRIARAFREK